MTAHAAETYGNFSYIVKDDGTAEITDYHGDDTELIISSMQKPSQDSSSCH